MDRCGRVPTSAGVMKPTSILKKPTAVFLQSGPLDVGQGKITGVIALTLGGLAVLSVLAWSRYSARAAPASKRARAARTAAGCRPTMRKAPSATSPASSIMRGPAASR